MSIIEELLTIAFLLVCAWGVVVAQVIALGRIFKTRAWTFLMVGVLVIGLRQVWGFVRLPAGILKAQAQGVMPENLTAEQYITIAAAFIAIGFLIAGFDKLRRDLRKIGI